MKYTLILSLSCAVVASAATIVEFDHTAGSTTPSTIVTNLTSTASLAGSFTGTAATSIDQFNAAADNGLTNAGPASGSYTHYFSYVANVASGF